MSRRDTGTLWDSCKNLSSSREAIIDFDLVDKKRFDDFNDFNRNVKSSPFIQKPFATDPVFTSKSIATASMSFLWFSPSWRVCLVSNSIVECSSRNANDSGLILVLRSFCHFIRIMRL